MKYHIPRLLAPATASVIIKKKTYVNIKEDLSFAEEMCCEFILISANLGTRPVSELMNVRWRDVQVKKTLFKNWYNGTKDIYQLTCNVYINSKKTGERVMLMVFWTLL